jgi:hypothetical protein
MVLSKCEEFQLACEVPNRHHAHFHFEFKTIIFESGSKPQSRSISGNFPTSLAAVCPQKG